MQLTQTAPRGHNCVAWEPCKLPGWRSRLLKVKVEADEVVLAALAHQHVRLHDQARAAQPGVGVEQVGGARVGRELHSLRRMVKREEPLVLPFSTTVAREQRPC